MIDGYSILDASLQSLTSFALLWALASTRFFMAFMLIPLFTSDVVPAMVRNAMSMAFGMLALVLQPPGSEAALMKAAWPLLYAKEVFIGGALGFLFSTILWAFEAAGQIIDTKVGSTMAQINDPMSGAQVTLTGAFLGRIANFIFMFSGGFLLFIGTLMDSFVLWPMLSFQPVFVKGGFTIFEAEFGRLMMVAFLIAAPAVVVLFTVEGMLGLINRYAQQLNVYQLSMGLKMWAANLMVLLMLPTLVTQLLAEIQSRPAMTLRLLKALLGGTG